MGEMRAEERGRRETGGEGGGGYITEIDCLPSFYLLTTALLLELLQIL